MSQSAQSCFKIILTLTRSMTVGLIWRFFHLLIEVDNNNNMINNHSNNINMIINNNNNN